MKFVFSLVLFLFKSKGKRRPETSDGRNILTGSDLRPASFQYPPVVWGLFQRWRTSPKLCLVRLFGFCLRPPRKCSHKSFSETNRIDIISINIGRVNIFIFFSPKKKSSEKPSVRKWAGRRCCHPAAVSGRTPCICKWGGIKMKNSSVEDAFKCKWIKSHVTFKVHFPWNAIKRLRVANRREEQIWIFAVVILCVHCPLRLLVGEFSPPIWCARPTNQMERAGLWSNAPSGGSWWRLFFHPSAPINTGHFDINQIAAAANWRCWKSSDELAFKLSSR